VKVNEKTLDYSANASSPGWRYEGNSLTTVITLPALPVGEGVSIVVRRDRALMKRRAELDDFAGTMTRLREAYDTLNQTWPIGWSPDDLVDAMQTGDRLSYHPELAGEQITRLREMLPNVATGVNGLEQNLSKREALTKRLSAEYKSAGAQEIGANYREKLARAKAAIADVPGPQQ
jgi:hypothetical protein